MKSERAKKFIDDDAIIMNNGDRMVDASTAYTAIEIAEQDAEKRMRKELLRWYDPKEELPEEECRVLIKVRVSSGTLQQVAIHRNGRWLYTFNHSIVPILVVGWRPIYE